MHLPGANTPKMVHPAICPCVTHYLKSGKNMHTPGAQVSKPVHPSVKMFTPGAGFTLNFEHCKDISCREFSLKNDVT